MQSFRTIFSFVALCLGCLIIVITGTLAVHAQNAGSAISRGFTTSDSDIVNAALVSTQANDPSQVQLANSASKNRLAGVVSSSAALKLTPNSASEVQVVLSGATQTLVSDINGAIRAGDKITVSPIQGVGMLATGDGQIVGTALTALNTNQAEQQQVTDKNGNRQTVHIGSVPLEIGVSYYAAPTSQFVPPFFQNVANTIAARPVSLGRIMLSFTVLLLAFVSISVLIATSVRAGIVSLGRNPLAAGAIRRGMFSVAFIGALIATLTLISVYLILIF